MKFSRSTSPSSSAKSRKRRSRIASTGVVAIVAAGMFGVAVASDGSTVHEADLSDGGVWLTSDKLSKFGRLNKQATQFDAGVAADVTGGSSIDVLQDGAAVLAWTRSTQQVQPINTRTAVLEESSTVTPAQAATPEGLFPTTILDLRGGTAAVVEEKTGKVWVQRVNSDEGVSDLAGLAASAKPVATVGGLASLAVGVNGTVYIASGEKGTLTSVAQAGTGFAKPVSVPLAARGQGLQVTAIGARWAVYDPNKDRLHSAEKPEGVTAGLAASAGAKAYAAVQVPSADAGGVAIEGVGATRVVKLDGGEVPGGVEVSERVNRASGVPSITQPVFIRGCLHSAWAEPGKVFYGANCGRASAVPTATLENVSDTAIRDGIRFRVNRNYVVLNDLDNGTAWDVDNDKQRIDNWDALIPPPSRDDQNKKKDKNLVDEAVLQQPPTAKPDNLKVRAGRTSKLYVLDNDTDVAGSILAINPNDVTRPSNSGVAASVAGDGQSVDVTVPDSAQGSFDFSYKVGNGKVTSKPATVRVTIVGTDINTPPHVRQGDAKLAKAAYPVLAGQRIAVPVAGDWRDDEADTVTINAADASSNVDGGGRITYLAGTDPGTVAVPFLADDGRGGSTQGKVSVDVVGPTDTRARPPVTQPDVVRGVVGKPLQIEPLGNDVAGADPGDPGDVMHLAGDIRPQGNITVDTNKDTGVVTVTPGAPGTFTLTYAAQVGGGVTPGRIRVDAVADPNPDAPPVAVPDSGTLRGQQPTVVDVLSNDYSPRADVLVTRSVAVPDDSDWIRASIFQGRWLRLQALDPSGKGGRTGTVRYVVSDGSKTATGEVNVVQKDISDVTPVVMDDKAVVRQGDSVTIPVLDNDTMADGIPLKLDPRSVKVLGGGEQTAFASGNVVRFVPKVTGPKDQQVTIEYAAFAEGAEERAQTGRINVLVTAPPSASKPNQAPVARSFSSSVTAGDPLTITVPTSGIDADGDTATLRGLVAADSQKGLKYGRIVSVGPDSMRYESYPTAAGTEVIPYEVTDRYGATSQAFVRVGVIAPGDPQPPVAVQDTVTAAPGKRLTIPVTTNDLIARGDVIDLETKSLNSAEAMKKWTVDNETLSVSTVVPDEGSPVHQLTYSISNGMFDPSRTSVLVRPQKGFINPPIARDDVAKPKGGETTALVDVLENDYDIDSAPGALTISQVLSPQATIEGGKVRVQIIDHGYTVPYVVKDDDGATGMALIYVPTGSQGQPYVVSGALITMDKDSSKSVKLADYVKSPQGRAVGISSASTLSSSPEANLRVVADGSDGLSLTSSNGYVGPAAVALEVSDQATADQKEVRKAYVTIPVQVGPKVALLRCPDTELTIVAGGNPRRVDIPTLCHTWLPVGMTMNDVDFESKWTTRVGGVDLAQEKGDPQLTLTADDNAKNGTGTLNIGVVGGAHADIRVRVIGGEEPPAPRLRPMAINGLQAGDAQSIDVASYLDSPLADPQCRIQQAGVSAGTGLRASTSGCTLTVTAADKTSPTGAITVSVSDGPGREAIGQVDVTMLNRPDAPTGVSARPDREAGGRAQVAWVAPGYDGGAPIRTYTVYWTGGSTGSRECTASPCTIDGLTNGKDYFFTVSATNVVDEGEKSAPSGAARPDTKPGATGGVTMISRGDGTLTVGWSPPDNKGSAITKYIVRLIPTDGSGSARNQEAAATAGQVAVGGLNNETEYSVAVQAWNEAGAGPFGAAVPMQSAGKPPAVGAPTLKPDGVGPSKDLANVSIAWNPTRPNGPALKGYAVYRSKDGGAWTKVANTNAGTLATQDSIQYDGSQYRYVVTATNGADLESDKASPSSYTSIGQPSTPTVRASTPTGGVPPAPARVAFLDVQVGQPRSKGFQSITWSSSSGASGTFSCSASSCPPGGTVRITTPALAAVSQSFTVRTSNGTTQSSAAGSGAVTPYGKTPAPNAGSSSANGKTVKFNWSLPTNGRPIDRVEVSGDISDSGGSGLTSTSKTGDYDTTYTIKIRSHSEAGWSEYTTMTQRSDKRPNPQVTRVYQSAKKDYTSANGTVNCAAGAKGCPRVTFDYKQFPAGSYNYQCYSQLFGSGVTGTARLNGAATYETDCLYGVNIGSVWVHVWGTANDGTRVDVTSSKYPWPDY